MMWERGVGASFENRGVAYVEQVNERWTLRVECRGTHVTYLDATSIDLASYRGEPLRARYRWVDRVEPDPRCIRQPCTNITTRVIVLESLDRLGASETAAAQMASSCR